MIKICSDLIVCISIGIILSLISILTTIGNLFVLFAFYYDKKLRTINDYFIMNMAMADFLVGFICIPFYIPFSILNIWPFGRIFCQIWVTIDDVATMTSVINIVAITINRYWLIAYPISYRKYVQRHFVYFVMGSIWIISFRPYFPTNLFVYENNLCYLVNFAPGIWLMNLFDIRLFNENDCSGDYNHSFIYMIIAQFNYFVFPFLLLCLFNLLILRNIWQRTKKMSRVKTVQLIEEKRKSGEIIIQSKKTLSSDYSSMMERKSFKTNVNSIDDLMKKGQINRIVKDFRIKRDRKSARSLFILVFVFLIFLFPYVICSVIRTAGYDISDKLFQISFWLLWINSTLNPFLYPFIQIKYRRAYQKLFKSFFKSSNSIS